MRTQDWRDTAGEAEQPWQWHGQSSTFDGSDAQDDRRDARSALRCAADTSPRRTHPRNGLCAIGVADTALRGVTILAVDEEPQVLKIIAQALREINLRIVACRDAEEGLGAFALLDGPAVLITDAALQRASGMALAQTFRRARPDGVVVFTSRFPARISAAGIVGARDIVLRKPFGAGELRAAICRATMLAAAGPRSAARRR